MGRMLSGMIKLNLRQNQPYIWRVANVRSRKLQAP